MGSADSSGSSSADFGTVMDTWRASVRDYLEDELDTNTKLSPSLLSNLTCELLFIFGYLGQQQQRRDRILRPSDSTAGHLTCHHKHLINGRLRAHFSTSHNRFDALSDDEGGHSSSSSSSSEEEGEDNSSSSSRRRAGLTSLIGWESWSQEMFLAHAEHWKATRERLSSPNA